MNSKTINFVISSRNREVKSAYSISASGVSGFVVDCDSGTHSTNLTTFLKEILKVAKVNTKKYDKSKAIQMRIGDIWFPPIFMNNNSKVSESMKELSSNLKKFYNRNGNYSLTFPVEKLNISQFQGNMTVSVDSLLEKENRRVSCNHVFLDCSGNLLANGTSVLKKSIQDIRENLYGFEIIFHYIMRIREVVSQEYYNKAPVERRRDILLYCIQKELEEKLDISLRETGDKLPPMARYIDGFVLVFNLYNEDKRLRDALFGDMLEDDLKNISVNLKWGIPKLQGIYTMEKCKKLLGSSKRYHERMYDYLTASMSELPCECLERIG